MRAICFIITLVLFATVSRASEVGILTAAQWVDLSRMQLTQAKAQRQFTPQQSEWLLLPSHAWLVTTPEMLELVHFSAGETPKFQRHIPKTDWLCAQARCQLRSTEQNRLIHVTYHGNTAQPIALWQGRMHHHRDPFRRALSLPSLDSVTLQLAQDTEKWFHLSPKQVTSVFFEQAKKLKLAVRKDLHHVEQNGVVTIKINGEVVSTIPVSDLHADEFLEPKVGLQNQDYIAVPSGSYVTVSSTVPVYLTLMQMHRGIYDDNAGTKQQESLFNPYWSKQLNTQLSALFLQGDTTVLTPSSNDTLLGIQRRQMLNNIVSRPYFVIPNAPPGITNHVSKTPVMLGSRSASGNVLPITGPVRLNYVSTEKSLTYSLDGIPRVDNTVTFYIRSVKHEQLSVVTEHEQHTLLVSPSSHFQRLNITLTAEAKRLTLSGSSGSIDIALAVNRLQPFPDFNPMTQAAFGQQQLAQALVNQSKGNRADTYKLSLAGLHAPIIDTTIDSFTQFNAIKILAELRAQSTHDPLPTLSKLKPFLNGYNEQVTLMAWRLNIELLLLLKRQGNAELLLKSLLLSQFDALKTYATGTLLTRYLEVGDYIQAIGLCAAYENDAVLHRCNNVLLNYLLDAGFKQEALWTSQHMRLSLSQQQAIAATQKSQFDLPQYRLSHNGMQTAETLERSSELYKLAAKKPIRIVAETPLTVKLSARSIYQGQEFKQTQWLYYEHNKKTNILPIFSDIAANFQLLPQKHRLSVASQQYIELAANESVTLFSEQPLFLDIALQTPTAKQQPFTDLSAPLLNSAQALVLQETNAKAIALNALYLLSQQTLSNASYIAVLHRLKPAITDNAVLSDLYDRLMRYGQWHPAEQYTNYVGTQKVKVEAIAAQSYADQITAHLTQSPLSGLVLRANDLLTIDFSQYQQVRTRVKLAFSSALQIAAPLAKVELLAAGQGDVISLHQGQPIYYGIKPSEARNGLLQLRWLNPLSGQMLTVTPQYFTQGQWQDIPLDTRQIFYRAAPHAPITATLARDSLIKIETFDKGVRKEATYFHPAGQVTLTGQNEPMLARLSIWSLSPARHRVNLTPEAPMLLGNKSTTAPASAPSEYRYARIETDESKTAVEGFMIFDHDDITQTTAPSPSRTTLDLGLSLRIKRNTSWYRIDTFYTLDNQHQETLSINGQYDWLSTQTSWFAEAKLNNRWQDSTTIGDSHLTSRLRAKVGQIHRYNSGFRSIWWWQPFYTYTSISKDEFIADSQISPDMYTFYRNNHRHGWRAHGGLRYQPWIDSYVDSSITLTSNQDWQTLDSALFSLDWHQYYQGHIFRAGITSSYVFADAHRPNPTWQYLTKLGWQTGFDFSHNTAGWLSLTWTQDWFNNTHQVGFQVHLGNLQQTGFAPYSHDEIVFESLQLSHLLEQDLNER
ncbi:hypothetical protein [Pseudoalteromonas piscicida]|uniref:Uncharacterized protein n=1 Tax=Pseudoalteromonas piscicida TaxID=43662 RepID=A0A2A5JQX2_PSEO7|nr:hypothetical protein [Pseudoalteromonas piscicida]PCK31729.1 hypothetical protein CEX98_10775 [Pseudoalteromonas piscicida]